MKDKKKKLAINLSEIAVPECAASINDVVRICRGMLVASGAIGDQEKFLLISRRSDGSAMSTTGVKAKLPDRVDQMLHLESADGSTGVEIEAIYETKIPGGPAGGITKLVVRSGWQNVSGVANVARNSTAFAALTSSSALVKTKKKDAEFLHLDRQ